MLVCFAFFGSFFVVYIFFFYSGQLLSYFVIFNRFPALEVKTIICFFPLFILANILYLHVPAFCIVYILLLELVNANILPWINLFIV